MTYRKIKDDAITDLKESVSEIKDDLNSVANQAGRKFRKILTAANDEFFEVSDKVTSEIRSNPVRSSAIALGVGFVVGLLLSVRRGN